MKVCNEAVIVCVLFIFCTYFLRLDDILTRLAIRMKATGQYFPLVTEVFSYYPNAVEEGINYC